MDPGRIDGLSPKEAELVEVEDVYVQTIKIQVFVQTNFKII